MPLSPGDKLGPYQIVAPIAAGGMGEVYRARDTRLDRIVAIKTSKTEFSERFEREARAVASLNHPNICQLYDVAALPEGGSYLVMEFIEGSPIAPVDSARKLLDLAVQIADGGRPFGGFHAPRPETGQRAGHRAPDHQPGKGQNSGFRTGQALRSHCPT